MSLHEFRKALRSKAVGPGARWARADFHVHMPGSGDYEYKQPDALKKMADAIDDLRLDFAVILKHQEFPTKEELKALQALCPNTLLVPGAEINVIVDALFKKIGKDYFFHAIVAVDPESPRDYAFPLELAKEKLTYRDGEYPAGFRSSLTDLGRVLREAGALFIPAHLHQAKEPEKSRSVDDLFDDDTFLQFVRDGAFTAMEVRQLQTAAYFDGEQKTADGQSIPRIACVRSSDAHSHDHLTERRRFSWVRVERRSFDELAAAVSFPHRVKLEDPAPSHARVLGLHVSGSFLGECWLNVNEGINALIGSKGSGKTSILECLRFVLATPVPPERKEAVKQHLQHILGSSGYVDCLIALPDGQEILVTRRADGPGRIAIQDAAGNMRSLPESEGVGIPVSILGWHEIEAIADRASSRISLLDRVSSTLAVRVRKQEIALEIEKARDAMPHLQRALKRLEADLKQLWILRRRRATLQKLEKDDLSTLQSDYEWFLAAEQRAGALRDAAEARVEQLPAVVRAGIAAGLSLPREGGAGEGVRIEVESIGALLNQHESTEKGASDAMVASLSALQEGLEALRVNLSQQFALFRDDVYTPRVNALPVEEREVLTRQIQVLEETKDLPRHEGVVASALKTVRDLAVGLFSNCDHVCELREQIVAERRALVEQVNDELSSIQLEFLRSGNREAMDGFNGRYPGEAQRYINYLGEFSGVESFERLRSLFARIRDYEERDGEWGFNDILYDARTVDLFDVLDDDDVSISLQVGKAGFVPLQRLSAGQRCVAVFPLLLRDTRGPLFIDQPEDNLDNRYIADVIAPDLLKRKEAQQFLVTSHNANLVVLTDADLVCHVDSDGTHGRIVNAGFLACAESEVKVAVLDVLDGGEGALVARQRKYGLSS